MKEMHLVEYGDYLRYKNEELMKAYEKIKKAMNCVALELPEQVYNDVYKKYEHFATLALKELEEQKQAYEIMDSACVKALNKWDKCKSRIAKLEDIIKRARGILKDDEAIDRIPTASSILSEAEQTDKVEAQNNNRDMIKDCADRLDKKDKEIKKMKEEINIALGKHAGGDGIELEKLMEKKQ